VALNPATGAGGIVVALVCAAGCGYTLRTIRIRSRPGRTPSDRSPS
jgi:hypothetical protein